LFPLFAILVVIVRIGFPFDTYQDNFIYWDVYLFIIVYLIL